MKISLALLFIFFSGWTHAEVSNDSCANAIEKHLLDAIHHNKKAAPRYSSLSQGQSIGLSYTLINLERLSIPLMKKIEKQARPYREKGIPLLCEEIPDMSTVPDFKELLLKEERPQELYHFHYHQLNAALKEHLNKDELEETRRLVTDELQKLESAPHQMCLTRHFLEAMAATLKLAEPHRNEAAVKGLPDPLPLIKDFLHQERKALFLTRYMDNRAFPLQKEGLLIFCQDVPAIDWK